MNGNYWKFSSSQGLSHASTLPIPLKRQSTTFLALWTGGEREGEGMITRDQLHLHEQQAHTHSIRINGAAFARCLCNWSCMHMHAHSPLPVAQFQMSQGPVVGHSLRVGTPALIYLSSFLLVLEY